MLAIKRIYEAASPEDGKRYLVDRIWPRGLSREHAHLDGWLKALAPSTALRVWFNHAPAKWEAFSSRYREELAAPEAAALLQALREAMRHERVTLLFAAKEPTYNHAAFLKAYLEQGQG